MTTQPANKAPAPSARTRFRGRRLLGEAPRRPRPRRQPHRRDLHLTSARALSFRCCAPDADPDGQWRVEVLELDGAPAQESLANPRQATFTGPNGRVVPTGTPATSAFLDQARGGWRTPSYTGP